MLMVLTGKEKRALRAQGNQLKAELWIGKDGISEGTLQSLDNSFQTKELVKIKLQENCPLNKQEVAEELCKRSGATLVQILGNTILL
ncbi:MAG: YhbY family RNA-binding protein, partial [Methanobacteriota archaeon]